MSNTLNGKILSGIGGLYSVLTENGGLLQCKARGSFRYSDVSPYPGDNVTVSEEQNGNSVITGITGRKNFIARPPCANIDKLFLTIACAEPEPSYITADKLICAAEYYGVETVVIVTKNDLAPEKAAELKNVYGKSGYKVFVTSSEKNSGVAELKEFVYREAKGCTSVFAGESGVGKSSLMNALFPSLGLKTGDVSRKIARGKHTTRAVTLFPADENPLPDGTFIADTPGFGIFDVCGIEDLQKEEICGLFPEFRDLTSKCRYTKCTHLREEGCAVLEAVKNGSIAPQRHESFVTVYEEIKKAHPFRKMKK